MMMNDLIHSTRDVYPEEYFGIINNTEFRIPHTEP